MYGRQHRINPHQNAFQGQKSQSETGTAVAGFKCKIRIGGVSLRR